MNIKNGADDVDWSDLRVFLAVFDGGNLVSAAETLGMSQPTVGRRLAALEQRLGSTLFARTGRRMQPTDLGLAILESARRIASEVDAVQRTAAGAARGLCGEVTISATEGAGTEWLIPMLGSLRERYPEITIRLNIEARAVNLVQREADIALRLVRPSQLDLIARKLATVGFGYYAAGDMAKRYAHVESEADFAETPWIRSQLRGVQHDVNDPIERLGRLSKNPVLITNNLTAQLAAAREGLGVTMFSNLWASRYPDLVRLLPEVTAFELELWLVTHEDLRHSARIRAVADHIAKRAQQDAELFYHGLS